MLRIEVEMDKTYLRIMAINSQSLQKMGENHQ